MIYFFYITLIIGHAYLHQGHLPSTLQIAHTSPGLRPIVHVSIRSFGLLFFTLSLKTLADYNPLPKCYKTQVMLFSLATTKEGKSQMAI